MVARVGVIWPTEPCTLLLCGIEPCTLLTMWMDGCIQVGEICEWLICWSYFGEKPISLSMAHNTEIGVICMVCVGGLIDIADREPWPWP